MYSLVGKDEGAKWTGTWVTWDPILRERAGKNPSFPTKNCTVLMCSTTSFVRKLFPSEKRVRLLYKSVDSLSIDILCVTKKLTLFDKTMCCKSMHAT